MKKMLILSFILLFSNCVWDYEGVDSLEVTLASWNVQNLFDAVSDGNEYDEFNPEKGKWNSTLFKWRLGRLVEVLKQFPKGDEESFPDILLLQEVENRNVVESLNKELGSFYRYSAVEQSDDRAITTAVLSRFPIVKVHSHQLGFMGEYSLRPVQEVHISLGGETLVVFNNHWKSKGGSASSTEEYRLMASSTIKKRVKVLKKENPDYNIILGGDFNEEPSNGREGYLKAIVSYNEAMPTRDENSLLVSFSWEVVKEKTEIEGETIFYSPWESFSHKGSYLYRGNWERIDHFFLEKNLKDGNGWEYKKGGVLTLEELFTSKGEVSRYFTTDEGGVGYSDHLPLYIVLDYSEQ